MLAVVEA